MPRVTIRTDNKTPDGREDELSEYLCDEPGCLNVATHALGCAKEIGIVMAVCDDHMPKPSA